MYSLTADQIKHFEEKGWVGPLDTFSLEEMEPMKECLESNSLMVEIDGQYTPNFYNNVLNVITPRDQHLFHKPVVELYKSPKIVQRLNQLGESNLLLWQTNIFYKAPTQGLIKWHQAIQFYTASDIDFEKKTLVFPKDEDALNLTVWLAVDDATPENGCLRFANGTHKKEFKVLEGALPAKEGMFAGIQAHKSVWQAGKKYALAFEFNETDWEVEEVPVKAGQIIIFTERTMHSSAINNSKQRRLALNARYVRPSVLIYPGRLKGDFIDENGHNVQRHFSIMVSGRDDYGINVIREWNDLDETEVEFQTMANLVRYDHVELPADKRQLDIYGLYQQAVEGDCQTEEPDPIRHARKYLQWQAWNRYQGISRAEAMQQYSQLVATLPRKDRKVSESDNADAGDGDAHKKFSTAAEIQSWLVSYVAELLKIEPDEIDVTTPFEQCGLNP